MLSASDCNDFDEKWRKTKKRGSIDHSEDTDEHDPAEQQPDAIDLLHNPVIPAKAGIQRNRDNPLRLVPRLRGG
jgi:hypothetical protein